MQKLKINNLLKILCLMFVLLSFTTSEAQQIFQKEYFGGSVRGPILEDNSGYYFASSNYHSGSYASQIYVYHTDHSGNVIWGKHIGKNYPVGEFLTDYIFTQDSTSIIFVGHRGTSNSNLLFFKMDINGNLIWHRLYGDSLSNSAQTIMRYNNHYYIGGYALADFNNSNSGLGLMLKIDDNGNILSENYYSTTLNNPIYIYGIYRNQENIYLTGSYKGSQDTDILFIKTDTFGNIITGKKFGTNLNDFARSIIDAYDNNLILSGSTEEFTYPTRFVIKISGNGNILWSKIIDIGSSNDGYKLIKTNDYGYVFGTASGIIITTDSLFNIVWSSKFTPGFLINGFYNAFGTLDGGIIAGGVVNNVFNSLIVKIDSNFDGGCNQLPHIVNSNNTFFNEDTLLIIELFPNLYEVFDTLPVYNITISPTIYCQTGTSMDEIANNNIRVFPNPYRDDFIISGNEKLRIKDIHIVDRIGNQYKISLNFDEIENHIEVEENKLPSGFYILQIEDQYGKLNYIKLLKQ